VCFAHVSFIIQAGNGIIAGATSMNMAIVGSCVFGLGFSAQGQLYAIAAEVLPRRHRGSASILNQVGACLGEYRQIF
jgi:ribose 1,5-bisphosphokinase PhnN